jgi:hypothetical protein
MTPFTQFTELCTHHFSSLCCFLFLPPLSPVSASLPQSDISEEPPVLFPPPLPFTSPPLPFPLPPPPFPSPLCTVFPNSPECKKGAARHGHFETLKKRRKVCTLLHMFKCFLNYSNLVYIPRYDIL